MAYTHNMMGTALTEQGAKIADAIESGLDAMTTERWREVEALAAEFEDEGEWFAPEFAAARKATEGISWDFDGWQSTLNNILAGHGKLGGVSLLAEKEVA